LTLPETGVCGGAGIFDEPAAEAAGGCCGGGPDTAQVLSLSAAHATG
jgi:hypothetical protein